MTNFFRIRASSLFRHSAFVLRHSVVELSTRAVHDSQHDRLPARGTDAHHGEFCTGQFGDVSDIFSRGRRKLRKFACSVYGRIPASDFFVDRFAIRQLSCVTRRNIQPFSVVAGNQHKCELDRPDLVHPGW